MITTNKINQIKPSKPIKTISIVGLGTLGSQVAKQAALSGYHLNLIDFDEVEARNIPIQSLYHKQDIGKLKTEAAARNLKQLNPGITIRSFPEKLVSSNTAILKADLVIDCTDNLTARFLLNDYCYNKIPLIHTAAFKEMATCYCMLPGNPCLHCIYPSNLDANDCRQSDINPSLPAKVAEMVIRQLQSHSLIQESPLLRLNLRNNTSDKIKISRRCQKCEHGKGVY